MKPVCRRWTLRCCLGLLALWSGPLAAAPAPLAGVPAPALEMELWPAHPPGQPLDPERPAQGSAPGRKPVAGRPWLALYNVSEPTLSLYPATAPANGTAVVVFPGGGYHVLAVDLEGTEICDWLVARGVACVLLKYRVPGAGPHWDKACQCHRMPAQPMALQDAQRAVSLLRQHAAAWRVDPARIGVIGFSAGGHLVADISTHAERAYPRIDAADDFGHRPDFAIALYPGHLWKKPGFALEDDVQVTAGTPPTFLLHAADDPIDDLRHSLVYAEALHAAGIPLELHVYPDGGHAFGLRPTAARITRWPALVEDWMRSIGMLPTAP